jgi:hypothetical protein
MSEESSARGSRVGQVISELEARDISSLPELRFRADAPSVISDGGSDLDVALQQLQRGEIQLPDAMVVRGSDGEPKGVLVSTKRYFQLAASVMRQEDLLRADGPRGPMPVESAFVRTMTEQVDPNQPWGGPDNPVLPLDPQ